jgi:hypothetical protein
VRYLDQEREAGEDTVRFQERVRTAVPDRLHYGEPRGVSLRDYDMAVTGLRLDVGSVERLAVLREPRAYAAELVVVRGETIIASLGLMELPVAIAGVPWSGTGPYDSTPRSPLPVYFYNPVRQNLTFAMRGEWREPVKLRFWWERLERRVW